MNNKTQLPEGYSETFYEMLTMTTDKERLDVVTAKFPDHGLNDHQLNILLGGYGYPKFIQVGFTPTEYFMWLWSATDKDDLQDRFMGVAHEMLQEMQRSHIAQHGWSIVQVGSGKTDPSFAYTVGYTAKMGVEFIVVGGGVTGGNLLNYICDNIVKSNTIPLDTPLSTGDYLVTVDGQPQPLRLRIVELDMGSVTAGNVTSRVPGIDVTRILQLQTGDRNNILPGEPGYDGLVQELTEE